VKQILTKAAVEAVIDRCGNDGHGILAFDKLKEVEDIPSWFLDGLVREHGGGGGKYDVLNDKGENVLLTGVYTLDMLSKACGVLSLKVEGALGRGTQARYYTDALSDWVSAQ
tara:strand:- start:107 stop:442 length:336 start_codon:yes stop_codon:yes gene_type:complete